MTASVTSTNHAAKTAVVSGTATPNGTVTIGSKVANVNSSGNWSMTVEGLSEGANTLTAIQKVNNTEVDRKNVVVTINTAAIIGQDGAAVTLERGEDTSVEALFETSGNISYPQGKIEFTAPAGTTFAPGQDSLLGAVKKPGNTWDTSYPRLTDGTLSEDGTKYTYSFATASNFREPDGTLIRWNIDVTTPAEAAAATGSMTANLVGTATEGTYNATATTPTTIEAPSVAAPTGTVTFSDDVTQKATVSGTGVDGATITLYAGDSTTAIGTAVVNNGTWTTTIDPIGAGDQKIRIEQSGIDGIQTAETTAEYGAAVTLDDPASSTVTPGNVTVTGSGQANTTVTITGGAKSVTTTVEADGTFSAEVELEPSNTAKTLTAQQRSKGNLTTSDTITVTPNGAQTARDVVITEPTSHTYRPDSATTISGTATPYATVALRFQWNDTVYGTAKADINGNWSITRGFGPSAKYELTATQTRFDTTTSASAMFALDPEGITNQEVVITGPADHAYTPGEATRVTGTATPYATIELRFQWNNTVYGTARANANGEWNIVRNYGPSATYELTATQLRADGTTSLSNTFTLEATGIDRPFTLTTPTMDSTFEAGVPVSFTGTGTRGATITAIAPAWNNNEIFTTEVDDNGHWDIRRSFAPGITYDLTLVQQPVDGEPTSIAGVRLTPAN
ncbi:Ig-like domain-containing protein [Curtobacterium flaccumfaciens]|uniref:Ig-like domain-containing protein n=1 Tax=Curtobacterium flaccumfaciens TaxID=2035 RepID=UPI002175B2D1|nr:Ig-like domain-containing protein [Curtobacterium flaccumfaciens]MCS5494409.1 Ig-like domain-containing protein [Curtobacterium flaccumfaciens pv. flaccumfaciens]